MDSEPVYHWSADKYIRLVEHTQNPMLDEYQRVEANYIAEKIENPKSKTFVDVGAGYGRILPQIAKVAKEVLAVELDGEMLGELQRRALV